MRGCPNGQGGARTLAPQLKKGEKIFIILLYYIKSKYYDYQHGGHIPPCPFGKQISI